MCQALFRQHVMQILLYITFTLILLYITWLLSEGNWVGKGRGDVTSTEDGWRLVLVERRTSHHSWPGPQGVELAPQRTRDGREREMLLPQKIVRDWCWRRVEHHITAGQQPGPQGVELAGMGGKGLLPQKMVGDFQLGRISCCSTIHHKRFQNQPPDGHWL